MCVIKCKDISVTIDDLNNLNLTIIKAAINFIRTKIDKILQCIKNNPNFVDFPDIKVYERYINIDELTIYLSNGTYQDFDLLLALETDIKLHNFFCDISNNSLLSSSSYKTICDSKELFFQNNFYGLYWWLTTSDDTDIISPGQSVDILHNLEIIVPYIEGSSYFIENCQIKEYKNFILYKPFKKSAKSNTYVTIL
jgi:hypothetical protein